MKSFKNKALSLNVEYLMSIRRSQFESGRLDLKYK